MIERAWTCEYWHLNIIILCIVNIAIKRNERLNFLYEIDSQSKSMQIYHSVYRKTMIRKLPPDGSINYRYRGIEGNVDHRLKL